MYHNLTRAARTLLSIQATGKQDPYTKRKQRNTALFQWTEESYKWNELAYFSKQQNIFKIMEHRSAMIPQVLQCCILTPASSEVKNPIHGLHHSEAPSHFSCTDTLCLDLLLFTCWLQGKNEIYLQLQLWENNVSGLKLLNKADQRSLAQGCLNINTFSLLIPDYGSVLHSIGYSVLFLLSIHWMSC